MIRSLRPISGLTAALLLVAAGSTDAAPVAKNGRIVFQRLDPRLGKTRLYTVQADGRGLRPLTTPRGDDDGDSDDDTPEDEPDEPDE